MYYVIERQEIPDDLIKEIERYVYLMGGQYIYIDKETLQIFIGYEVKNRNSNFIGIDKLKEILILKHLME